MSSTTSLSFSALKAKHDAALKQKEDIICAGLTFEDDDQRAMFIALNLGDKQLAAEMKKQDRENTTMRAADKAPTLAPNAKLARAQLYEWLVVTPYKVKEAHILGDFFTRCVRTLGGNPALNIPRTPAAHSVPLLMPDRLPVIYQTTLADNHGNFPTRQDLQTIIEAGRDLVSCVEWHAPSKAVVYNVRNLAQDPQLTARICAIENVRKTGLKAADVKKAMQTNIRSLSTRFFSNKQAIENWNYLLDQLQHRLTMLIKMHWPMQSPIPRSIAATGWTIHASNRRFQYESHAIGDLIKGIDAIARSECPTSNISLSWRVAQDVLYPESAGMYEHGNSLLGRTYINYGGLNIIAAGISVAGAYSIPYSAYQAARQRAIDHGEVFTQAEALQQSLEREAEELQNARILVEMEDELESLVAECATKRTELERVTKICNSTSREFNRKLADVFHRAQKVPDIIKETEQDLEAVRRWQLKFAEYDGMYPQPSPTDHTQRQRSSTAGLGALDLPLDRPPQRVRSGSHMIDRAASSQSRASSVSPAMQIKREHEEETALKSIEETAPEESPTSKSIKRLAHSLATLPGFSDPSTKRYDRNSRSYSSMANADESECFSTDDEISVVSCNRNAFDALTYEIQVVGKPKTYMVSYVALLGYANYAVADFHHLNPQAPGPWKGFKPPVDWTPPAAQHNQGSM